MSIDRFTVTLSGEWMISSNDRGKWSVSEPGRRAILAATTQAARHLDKRERATIIIGVTKSTARKYDAMNLYPTAKVAVDALVRMGKLPDDDNAHVIGPVLLHRGIDRNLAGRGPVKDRVRFDVRLEPYDLLEFDDWDAA